METGYRSEAVLADERPLGVYLMEYRAVFCVQCYKVLSLALSDARPGRHSAHFSPIPMRGFSAHPPILNDPAHITRARTFL